MKRSVLTQLREVLVLAIWPLIWAHELCHYWVARRLGLLARIEGTKTYVHRVNHWQHILIALAPTVPSAIFLWLSTTAYQRFAMTLTAKVYWGSIWAIAALLLMSCALDWGSIVRSILAPGMLAVDSSAILIVSVASPQERSALQSRLEKSGYFVDWVQSGQEALESLGRNPFDLIVMDVNLPGTDRETFRQPATIRQENLTASIFQLKNHAELSNIATYLETGVPHDWSSTAGSE